VRVVHLVRNPAAAVNGLIDGWLHRGFFSTNLEPYFRSGRARVRKLDIAGYSDTHPWGRRWWNFELHPDWESVARAPLGEVCAHQWRAANAAILEYLEERSLPHVRLRFEDFIESPGEHLEKLVDFMGLPPGSLRCWDGRLPVVQATESPRPHRWRARRHALLPFVQSPLTEGLARRLGYDPALLDDWR